MEQFPFIIRGFHSDNGSEFINYTVASAAGQVTDRTDQITSAPITGDNGLVECEKRRRSSANTWVSAISVRQHAEAVDQFHREYLNPYINFHRPCASPRDCGRTQWQTTDDVYRKWATPFEILSQTAQCESLSAAWYKHGRIRASFEQNAIRYRSCHCNATGQKANYCHASRKAERLRTTKDIAEPRSAVEMTGRMESEENQKQVSLTSHRLWKSLTARFPHFHRADYGFYFSKN